MKVFGPRTSGAENLAFEGRFTDLPRLDPEVDAGHKGVPLGQGDDREVTGARRVPGGRGGADPEPAQAQAVRHVEAVGAAGSRWSSWRPPRPWWRRASSTVRPASPRSLRAEAAVAVAVVEDGAADRDLEEEDVVLEVRQPWCCGG